MSINNLKGSELSLNQLDIVSGGGDCLDLGLESEKSKTREGVKCRYSVGQYVEILVVYASTGWHQTGDGWESTDFPTRERALITSIKIAYGPLANDELDLYSLTGYYYPVYTIRIESTGTVMEVTSLEFES